jgi:MarR family transcriptional regulator, 2-MHQ and catechol-resistance regulon repressor
MRIEDVLKAHFRDESHKAQANLIYTSNWSLQQFNRPLKKYGLSNEQFNVLRILRGRHPESYSLKEVTSRMINRYTNTTRIVERLIKKKFVKKEYSKKDKRQLCIAISKEGLNLLAKIDKLKLTDNIRTGLNEKENIQLNYLLDKMRDGE